MYGVRRDLHPPTSVPHFPELPMGLEEGIVDNYLPNRRCSKVVEQKGEVSPLEENIHDITGVTYRYAVGTMHITVKGLRDLESHGVNLMEVYAAQKAVVDTGYITQYLHGDAVYLQDDTGYERWKRLETFQNDINRIPDSRLYEAGVADPVFFRMMSLAYFSLNHRDKEFGGYVAAWHVLVEKIGYETFFSMVADGAGFKQITRFAEQDIDLSLFRSVLNTI